MHDDTEPTTRKWHRLPPSHQILAQIMIDPADWHQLQQLDAANPATQIVGHDDPQGELMTVYVACTSAKVRDRLLDGWG
jgi:hypothetical protein